MTQSLLMPFYNQSLYFELAPFSTWLEDVYIGMIAARLNLPIEDIGDRYVLFRDYTIEEKTAIIQTAGVKQFLFIYEFEFFEHYWNLTLF